MPRKRKDKSAAQHHQQQQQQPQHAPSLSQGSHHATASQSSSSLEELRHKLSKSASLETKLAALSTTTTSTTSTTTTSTKSESESSQLRMQICELLSDVLLADPTFSLRKDVSGRLWRSCFYGRITELRSRIGKERGRVKRALGKGDEGGAERHEAAVKKLESSLRVFLGEAVSLYEYLVDKYQRMLVPAGLLTQSQSQSQQSQSQTQSQTQSQQSQTQQSIYSQDDASASTEKAKGGGGGGGGTRELFNPNQPRNAPQRGGRGGTKRKQPTLTPPDDAIEHHTNQQSSQQLSPQPPPPPPHHHEVAPGTIPLLYKLSLNLGDLYRYSATPPTTTTHTNHGKAEALYTRASKLAPGKGNPYNQLAVVAQLTSSPQPLTAVALYWYARSLLATQEPFATSKSNLVRLFGMNRGWMDKHGGNGGGVGGGGAGGGGAIDPENFLSRQQSSQSAADDGGAIKGKRAQLEHARAIKSAASRKFLAGFVDVHYDLYRWYTELPPPIQLDPTPAEAAAAGGGGGGSAAGGGGGAASSSDGWPTVADVTAKMDGLTETFSALLAGAAFGDALLTKLVCVNAFAVCDRGAGAAVGAGDDKDKDKAAAGEKDREKATAIAEGAAIAEEAMNVKANSRVLAAAFTLNLGTALARNLEAAIAKLDHHGGGIQKGGQKGADASAGAAGAGDSGRGRPVLVKRQQSNAAVRLLSPFVVLCEVVSSFYGCGYSVEEGDCGGGGSAMALPPSCLAHADIAADAVTGGAYDNGRHDAATMAYLHKAERSFWTHAASVANLIRTSKALSSVVKSATSELERAQRQAEVVGAPPLPSLLPREYEDLRGYVPLEHLFSSSSSSSSSEMTATSTSASNAATGAAATNDAGGAGAAAAAEAEVKVKAEAKAHNDAYVTPEEAVRALDLVPVPSSSTCATSGGGGGSGGGSGGGGSEGDLSARLLRFLAFVHRHSAVAAASSGIIGGDAPSASSASASGRYLAKEPRSGKIYSALDGDRGGGGQGMGIATDDDDDGMDDDEDVAQDVPIDIGTGEAEMGGAAAAAAASIAHHEKKEEREEEEEEKNKKQATTTNTKTTSRRLIAEVKEDSEDEDKDKDEDKVEDEDGDEDEDEGGDLLVYKPGAGGSGPALLVPSSLLLSGNSGTKSAGPDVKAPPTHSTMLPHGGAADILATGGAFINPSALSAAESDVTTRASGQTMPGGGGPVGVPPPPQSILPPLPPLPALPQQQQQPQPQPQPPQPPQPPQQGHATVPPGFSPSGPVVVQQQPPPQPLQPGPPGYGLPPPPSSFAAPPPTAAAAGAPSLPPPGFQAPLGAPPMGAPQAQQYALGTVGTDGAVGTVSGGGGGVGQAILPPTNQPLNQPLGGQFNLTTRNPFEPNRPPLPNFQENVQQQCAMMGANQGVGQAGQFGTIVGGGGGGGGGGAAAQGGAAPPGEINLGSLPGFGGLALEQDNVFNLQALGIDDILSGAASGGGGTSALGDGAAEGGGAEGVGAEGVGVGGADAGSAGAAGRGRRPAYASLFGDDGLEGMPATRNPFAH